MLDVHILEAILVLFTDKLVKQRLLEVNPLQVQEDHHALQVSFVAHAVVGIAAIVVDVDFLVNYVLWRSHLRQEVERDVLKTEQAKPENEKLETW